MTSEKRKLRLMTHQERVKAYGMPFTMDANGTLKPSVKWEAANVERLLFSLSRPGETRSARVHKAAAPHFVRFFDLIDKHGLRGHLETFDGSLVVRMKRGKEKSTDVADASTHSFGAAIDLNAKWNPLGKAPAPAGSIGSLVELVPLAEECGLVWGGHWKKPDGMHFEVGVPVK